MKQLNIGIIGGGNMGSCIVGGLIQQGYPAGQIWVCDRGEQTRESLKAKWHIHTSADAKEVTQNADVLILAVKPQSLKSLLEDIQIIYQPTKTLLVSIAAGITTTLIQKWLGQNAIPLVRAMPNTPALLGAGMTGLFATPQVSPAQQETIQALFKALGHARWISDEAKMDIVTALSGSGPAYFFYVIECLIKSAQELGLSEEEAIELTLNTAYGSCLMALKSESSIETLREKVTSRGGTTQEGIKVLKDGKLERLIFNTLQAATAHSKFLSEQVK